LHERSKKKVSYDVEKLKACRIENLAYCSGRVDVEFCWLDPVPISLPLAGCRSLEVDRPPGTAGRRPRSDSLSILLFSDGPKEHYEALPVNGENLHLRLSKMEKLSFNRLDDYPRNRITKSAYPQTLLGHSLHIDRRRPVLSKPSILWLPLADRLTERVVPATSKNQRLEIRRTTSLLVASANFAQLCIVAESK
jgi:hypothetical protein